MINVHFNFRTFFGIHPDDGRHKEEVKFEQTKEWCEACQETLDIGGTEYVGEHQLWLCKKCKKKKEK